MAMNALQGPGALSGKGYGEIQVEERVPSALTCIDRKLDFVARHPPAIAAPAQGFVPNIGAA